MRVTFVTLEEEVGRGVGFGAGLWSNLVYESQPDGGDEGGGV